MPSFFSGIGPCLVIRLLLGRNFDVHDDAVGAGRHFQGSVFHVCRLFAENRAQQAFLGRQFGFALRRDFADQNVSGLDLRADANDAIGTKILECFFAEIGNVTGDFLRAEFGVAGAHFKFIDMNRSKDVFLDDALANQNGVFEVIAVPGHERDQHVSAQR